MEIQEKRTRYGAANVDWSGSFLSINLDQMATTESRCFHKKIVINQQASDNLNKKTKPPEKQRLISKCIVLNMALDT